MTNLDGTDIEQKTHYKSVEYFPNDDPLTMGTQPPLPHDIVRFYSVAPIFRKWSMCITRFKVTTICQNENPIVGLAL